MTIADHQRTIITALIRQLNALGAQARISELAFLSEAPEAYTVKYNFWDKSYTLVVKE